MDHVNINSACEKCLYCENYRRKPIGWSFRCIFALRPTEVINQDKTHAVICIAYYDKPNQDAPAIRALKRAISRVKPSDKPKQA